MKFDGVPFRPVTVSKVEDRPKLLVLCDVSLSVRSAARFTLQLVHSLQSLASSVRTFAFVKDLVEITDLFAEHHPEEALSLVMSGLPAGGVLDVDADSDYGSAFEDFLEQFGSAVTRRTTVIVLGDGRGNGNDPRLPVFEEITRRARETVWLTPEPRYSRGLGRCDLPAYADYCSRVRVVRNLTGLDRVTTSMSRVG
ncbi:VWA domain-containing protein [Nocardioides sp. B-3]|uniref:VWA domain-containing protein n=1 Tax=Nocardioides sp. B-3 TaxID=2895565 RepID=UPI003FA542B5